MQFEDPEMISYVTIGTNDLPRAIDFYGQLLALLGAKETFRSDRGVGWGAASGGMLAVLTPYDKQPAAPGNGNMVALAAPTTALVQALYTKALALGATDEGAPGERFPGFYAAYCRDLDGNKLAFTRIG
jgi:catechol 2,3-dioxygenase-like lactoylglutathione lyase family enzyme